MGKTTELCLVCRNSNNSKVVYNIFRPPATWPTLLDQRLSKVLGTTLKIGLYSPSLSLCKTCLGILEKIEILEVMKSQFLLSFSRHVHLLEMTPPTASNKKRSPHPNIRPKIMNTGCSSMNSEEKSLSIGSVVENGAHWSGENCEVILNPNSVDDHGEAATSSNNESLIPGTGAKKVVILSTVVSATRNVATETDPIPIRSIQIGKRKKSKSGMCYSFDETLPRGCREPATNLPLLKKSKSGMCYSYHETIPRSYYKPATKLPLPKTNLDSSTLPLQEPDGQDNQVSILKLTRLQKLILPAPVTTTASESTTTMTSAPQLSQPISTNTTHFIQTMPRNTLVAIQPESILQQPPIRNMQLVQTVDQRSQSTVTPSVSTSVSNAPPPLTRIPAMSVTQTAFKPLGSTCPTNPPPPLLRISTTATQSVGTPVPVTSLYTQAKQIENVSTPASTVEQDFGSIEHQISPYKRTRGRPKGSGSKHWNMSSTNTVKVQPKPTPATSLPATSLMPILPRPSPIIMFSSMTNSMAQVLVPTQPSIMQVKVQPVNDSCNTNQNPTMLTAIDNQLNYQQLSNVIGQVIHPSGPAIKPQVIHKGDSTMVIQSSSKELNVGNLASQSQLFIPPRADSVAAEIPKDKNLLGYTHSESGGLMTIEREEDGKKWTVSNWKVKAPIVNIPVGNVNTRQNKRDCQAMNQIDKVIELDHSRKTRARAERQICDHLEGSVDSNSSTVSIEEVKTDEPAAKKIWLGEIGELSKQQEPQIKMEPLSPETNCDDGTLDLTLVPNVIQSDEKLVASDTIEKFLPVIDMNANGVKTVNYQIEASTVGLFKEIAAVYLFHEDLCEKSFHGMIDCSLCNVTNNTFTSFQSYDNHLKNVHKQFVVYICAVCGDQRCLAVNAEAHLYRTHMAGPKENPNKRSRTVEISTDADAVTSSGEVRDGANGDVDVAHVEGEKDADAADELMDATCRNVNPDDSEDNISTIDDDDGGDGGGELIIDTDATIKSESSGFMCGICNIQFTSHAKCFEHMDRHVS